MLFLFYNKEIFNSIHLLLFNNYLFVLQAVKSRLTKLNILSKSTRFFFYVFFIYLFYTIFAFFIIFNSFFTITVTPNPRS